MSDDSDRLDQKFEALTSRERRKILDHFATTEADATTVEVLSCLLARVRADGGHDRHDQRPSTRVVRNRLHHVHLPKLEEYGLVEYDPRSGTVRYQSDELVEELLRVASGR